MTTDDRDDLDQLVRALPADEPPAGFADRVLHAHARARRLRRLRVAAGALGVPLAAAAATLLVLRAPGEPLAGEVSADARRSLRLGAHATAVLEPGAALRFAVDDGVVQARQPSGRAFYRVDPGTPLVVDTPAGSAVVHGTCFTVDVGDHAMTASAAPFPKHLASAAAGALVSAALVVTVYEGKVEVTNAHGSVTVGPGERGVVTTGDAAPTRGDAADLPAARLGADNDALRAALSAAEAAAGGDVQLLLAENQALRDRLARATQELALADEVRAAEEGAPVPFPADLPARFGEDALRKAFEAGLEEAGVQGGVIQVDCAEFPCIVFGQLTSREDMDKVRGSSALHPYEKDSNSTSVWGVKNDEGVAQSYFGVALQPDGKPDPTTEQRLEARLRSGWEQIRPPRR